MAKIINGEIGQFVPWYDTDGNEINVSDLPEGIYLLRITDADGRYHAKTLVRSW